MLISNVKTLLHGLAKHQTPLSVLLWGPTGIGKSSVVRQLADDLGYKLIDLRLSMREAVDILGMPYTSKTKLMNRNDEEVEMDTLDHHAPKWFVEALLKGKTVLFLDELNRARPEVLQAVFELALDRKLNNVKLPDDVIIISACNPPDGKYETISFDPALIARFMHIQVKPDLQSWLSWARSKDSNGKTRINPHVINYIIKHPEALHTHDPSDDEFPVAVNPHPRCWEFASLVEGISEFDEEMKKECLKGLVGLAHATAYIKEKTSEVKAISLDEVFDFNEEVQHRVKILSGADPSYKGKIRIDILNATCSEIEEKEVECRPHYKNVVNFLELLPGDLGLKTLKKIYYKEDTPWADEIVARPKLMARLKELKTAQTTNRVVPTSTTKPKFKTNSIKRK